MGSWIDRLLGRADGGATAEGAAQAEAAGSRPGTPRFHDEPLDRADIVEVLELKTEPVTPLTADPALVARVRDLFSKTSPVPGSPPQLAMRILHLIAQPDADADELAKLISLEPSLTAAVLRVANSPAYRAIGRIDSVRDAITRLGMREVARIGCALSAKSVFDPQRRTEQALFGPLFLEQFVHASATALASAELSLSYARLQAKADAIFLGGLLHDIGKSVALRILSTIVSGDPSLKPPTHEEAHAVLDAVHVEVGVMLHRDWSLPESSAQICLAHHTQLGEGAPCFEETHAVRLTSAMHLLHARPPTEARLTEVEESASVLSMTRPQLAAFNAELIRFREMAQELSR